MYDAVGAAASPELAVLYSHELYAMFYTAHKFPRRGRWVRGWARFPGTRRLYSLPGWIQRPGLELIGPASSWLEMLSGRLRSHQRSPSVSWLRVCVLPLLHPFPTHSECVLSIVELSFLLSLSLSLSLSMSICLYLSLPLSHLPSRLYLFRFFVFLSIMPDVGLNRWILPFVG